MAYSFNDEDKEEVNQYPERLPFGVSKVQIAGAVAAENENGKEYFQLTVVNEAGIERDVKLWFVGGASKFSFNTLKQIAVHNGKDDKAKEEMRLAVENTGDTDNLAELFNDKLVGGECWYTKYYDAERTYTTENGTFRSVNESVYGYEPKLKPELMPTGVDQVTKDTVDKIFPADDGETKTDASAGVPDNWAK